MVSWDECRREPFRLFFPLGILCGLLGVGHWLGYALGWSASSSNFYHASIQVGAYMVCFIIGFLLTALPRFAAAAPATTIEVLSLLGLLTAQLILLSCGWWIAAEGCGAGVLVLLAWFAARRFARRQHGVNPPTEFAWIPIALACGLGGDALLVLGQGGWGPAWTVAIGRPMAQQGFLLSIVLGVAGFLAPRLMGRTLSSLNTVGMAPEQAASLRRRRMALHGIAGIFLVASFMVEGAGAVGPAYLLRAMVVTAELAWTARFAPPPRESDQYVRYLWLSLWMVALGLWGAGLWPRYRIAMLHLMFLGGFSLMTFAVGTMVVLSHTGEGRRLQQPLWVLRVVGVGLVSAVIARVGADLHPVHYFVLLAVSAASWMVAGGSWLIFILPHVVRTIPAGTFEQTHEQAKRRVAVRLERVSRTSVTSTRPNPSEGSRLPPPVSDF